MQKSNCYVYNCPPGLLAVSVVFWSLQAKVLPLGILMAIVLEAPRWLSIRFRITTAHFAWLSNISSVVLLFCGILFFATNLEQSIFLLVEWIPVILFLLLVAQLYSQTCLIPLQAIMASIRGRKIASSFPDSIDLRLPYLFVTLISASMTAARDSAFFVAIAVLLMWILWSVRRHRSSNTTWLAMLGMSIVLGFFVQGGLVYVQGIVQQAGIEWLQDWSDKDPTNKSTAIGQLGQLKLSNKIAMRIKSSEHRSLYLHQASYDRYYNGTWYTNESAFSPTLKGSQDHEWNLITSNPRDKNWLRISAYLHDGKGTLALPRGSSVIVNPRAGELKQNHYASITIDNAPELVELKVLFDSNRFDTSKPMSHELELPEIYKDVTYEIVENLSLGDLSPMLAVQKLNDYFSRNFKYSLIQNESDIRYRPITHFLRKSRYGHCEYFATAGALVLRAAGIPSRYVSGYLMDEYQSSTDLYIVRYRHAHAWTRAFIDGAWVDLDFTPASWVGLEEAAAPWWEYAYDGLSHVVYVFQDWWWSKPRSVLDYLLLLSTFLLLFYVLKKARMLNSGLKSKQRFVVAAKQPSKVNGMKSPFYKIIIHLEKRSAPRLPGETTKQWLHRVVSDEMEVQMPSHNPSSLPVSLQQLLDWHYQTRFANTQVSLQEFDHAVNAWLESHS